VLVDEKKAMARRGSGISLLGLDLSDGDDMETQRQIVSVLRIYLDRQRALELYGALRPEIQTHLEDEIGEKLLPPAGEPAATLSEIRTLAQAHETRDKTRAADTARQLKRLGVDVSDPNKPKAKAKWTGGRGRGKGKGDKGKGGRAEARVEPCGATTTTTTRRTLESQWLVLTVSSTRTSSATAATSTAMSRRRVTRSSVRHGLLEATVLVRWHLCLPVVQKVTTTTATIPDATPIDIDALFEATSLLDGPDDGSMAMMKKLYLKAAERNAMVKPQSKAWSP
jgi:hypothetical protein